jgi:hypothetical protein
VQTSDLKDLVQGEGQRDGVERNNRRGFASGDFIARDGKQRGDLQRE